MLDIKFIRENKDLIKEDARKKCVKVDIDRLLAIDEKRRALTHEVDKLRQEHKKFTDASEEARVSKNALSQKEFELSAVEKEFEELMLQVPNVPDPSVPEGESDVENQEIRKWGKIKVEHGKNYLNLMQSSDMLDLERGAKVSGFRGYFLKGDAALFSVALWQFALDFVAKKGFTSFLSPALVIRENLVGTGWFPQAEEDVYSAKGGSASDEKTRDDIYLSGTAEIPMMGYHRDEILKEEELPKKYVAFSSCFRREAGSYGKDQKGIFRVH